MNFSTGYSGSLNSKQRNSPGKKINKQINKNIYYQGFSCSVLLDALTKPEKFSKHFLTDKEIFSPHMYI